jgi:two-component system response regulator AtoC
MEAYHWPGNIRELENVIKRYVILGSVDVVVAEICKPAHSVNGDYGVDVQLPTNGSIDLKEITREAVRKIERNVMLGVLERHQWNRKKAAKTLNISYRALLYKIKECGLQTNDSETEVTE